MPINFTRVGRKKNCAVWVLRWGLALGSCAGGLARGVLRWGLALGSCGGSCDGVLRWGLAGGLALFQLFKEVFIQWKIILPFCIYPSNIHHLTVVMVEYSEFLNRCGGCLHP